MAIKKGSESADKAVAKVLESASKQTEKQTSLKWSYQCNEALQRSD